MIKNGTLLLKIFRLEFSVSHATGYKNNGLLQCDVELFVTEATVFRRKLLPSSKIKK
jgi:hypothetical protein